MSAADPSTVPGLAPSHGGTGNAARGSGAASRPAGMLFAQLVLRAPTARGILITAPTSSVGTAGIAYELAALATSAGYGVRLVDLAASAHTEYSPDGSVIDCPPAGQLLNTDTARQILATPGAFTVAFGGGVLDTPATLIAAALMDGVIVVARQGRTTRSALNLVRSELERVGGHLLGAVLQD